MRSSLVLPYSGSVEEMWAEDGVHLKNGRYTHLCAWVEHLLFARQTPEPRELRGRGRQTSEEVACVPRAQITWGHRVLESVVGVPEMQPGEEFALQSQWGGGVGNAESWDLRNTEGEKPGVLLLGVGAPSAG